MRRITTGIAGLDKTINGGIPEGASVLITGSCGTGKSLLSLQYLVSGALKGEPGIYVTFEESKDKIIEHARGFGWDIPPLEKKGLIDIYVVETDDVGEIPEDLKARVSKAKAKRLVIDSLTTMMEHGVIFRSQISRELSMMQPHPGTMKFPSSGSDITRKDIYHLIGQINRIGTTSLLISEVAEKSTYLSRDTISEFAVDGVILLEVNTVGGSPERLISVKKMRGTPVDLTMSLMKFGTTGIEIEE
ncbi:MAG: ATPase domain-containing protein [Candidatus Altiarchaeota archaeon]